MTNDNLKPCPFCGGKASTLTRSKKVRDLFFGLYAHKCRECDCRTPSFSKLDIATTVWNRRADTVACNNLAQSVAPVDWSIGDDFGPNDSGIYTAGIRVGDHGNAVECYGTTAKEADSRRKLILGQSVAPVVDESKEFAKHYELDLNYESVHGVSSELTHKWHGWKARAALSTQPNEQIVYVPIATSSNEEVGGRHPNDKTPADEDCRKALDERGDDRGQGLSSYWKWGFRMGWHAHKSLSTQPTIADQIHYPACWDTVNYPTLESALVEIAAFKCSECVPKEIPKALTDEVKTTEQYCIESYGSIDDAPIGAVLCYQKQEIYHLRALLEGEKGC